MLDSIRGFTSNIKPDLPTCDNVEHPEPFLLLQFICYFLKLINSVTNNCVTIQMKPNPYSRQTLNRNAVRVKDFPAIY